MRQTTFMHTQQGGVRCGVACLVLDLPLDLARQLLQRDDTEADPRSTQVWGGRVWGGEGWEGRVTCEGGLCAHFSWLCLPVVEEE